MDPINAVSYTHLYSAVYRAVGADTEIQMLPAGFHTRTAEGAQFEGGIQSEPASGCDTGNRANG